MRKREAEENNAIMEIQRAHMFATVLQTVLLKMFMCVCVRTSSVLKFHFRFMHFVYCSFNTTDWYTHIHTKRRENTTV